MKELEKYIIRKDHNAFNKAQLKYFSYLKEGGKKTFEEIERCVFREYAQGNAW